MSYLREAARSLMLLQVVDQQMRGLERESVSVNDKLRFVELLDQLGVAYIEAGNPGSRFRR